MKTRDMKKVREILHLRRLTEARPELLLDEWQESEEPDFLIASPAGVIGLEITECHHDQASTARETQQRKTLREAERAYKTAAGAPLFVTVFWNNTDLSRTAWRELPQRIAGLVRASTPGIGGRVVLDSPDQTDAGGPSAIDRIEIYRYADEPYDQWYAPLDAVQPLSPLDLQSVLDAKDALVPKYRVRALAAWLLIVCGTMLKSSWSEIGVEVEQTPFRTGFDRVFVLSYSADQVCELQLEHLIVDDPVWSHSQSPATDA